MLIKLYILQYYLLLLFKIAGKKSMEKRLNFNVLTSDDSDDTSTSDYAFKINVNTNGLKLIEKGNESSGEEEFFF